MKRNYLLRQLLANVTDAELEKLLNFRQTITNNSLDKNAQKRRPVPTPRKSVKELVQQYEENIIQPAIQFRDRPVPPPRTRKQKPIAAKRTFIGQTEKALKGYTKSYEIEIRDEVDPLQQLNITKKWVDYKLTKQLEDLKGLKYVLTLKITFEKQHCKHVLFTVFFFRKCVK